jgi:putative serine protease PepD
VTDGGNPRQAGEPGRVVSGGLAGQPAAPKAPGPGRYKTPERLSSPWWSDAQTDPWRDPTAPATVVVRPSAAPADLEPAPDPDAGPRRGIGLIVLVSVFSALLAGALGGTLGYAFAVRGGHASGTVLGSATQAPALAQRPPESVAGVVKKVAPSVVTIRVLGGGGVSLGSGFVASDDGYVITNDHVVTDGPGSTTVTFDDGQNATAQVVGRDPESDIAVLKVARGGLTPVEFGDSDAVAVGDPVLAFGAPLALANTVTSGIVSALDRPLQEGTPGQQVRYYAAIQTDAAINHGNSGGPLVDGGGRVIGVNSVIKSLASNDEDAGNIGLAFAIPINQAKRIAQEIIDSGSARRTVIGAQVGASPGASGSNGVRVTSVESGGPAASAGLRVGDVITKLDGHPVGEPGDLIALVRKYAPGSVVSVEYRRGNDRQTASVTLAADAK